MKNPLTVLLIDSSARHRASYRRFLSEDDQFDYDFLEADSGAAALQLCQVNQPDVILLDYQLEGLEILLALAKQLHRTALPLLLLVELQEETIVPQALQLGAQDYLIKDQLTPLRLRCTVRNLLQRYALGQAATGPTEDRRQQQEPLRSFNSILNHVYAAIASYRLFATRSCEAESYSAYGWEYEFCSAGCEVVFGYKAEEFLSNQLLWQSRILPEDWEAIFLPRYPDLYAGRMVTIEYRFYHKDGSLRWISETATSQRDEAANCWIVTTISTDITERKRTEAALQQSEMQNRAVLAAIPDLMVRINREGIYQGYIRTNQLIDCIPEDQDPVGRHISEFLPPEVEELQLQAIEAVLATGADQVYEQQLLLNGQLQYEEVRVVAFGPDETLFMIRDITDRKQAELTLHRNESKIRALISALPDLIMRMTGDGIYLDFFPTKTFQVFGSVDLIGVGIFEDGLPQELAELRMKYIRQALQTSELQVYEQQILVNEQIRTEEVRIVVCDDNEVLVIVRDISDRKQAEQALKHLNEELELRVQQRTAALEASQARFRATFEQAAVGMVEANAQGQLLRMNQKFCDIMGDSEAKLIGKTLTEITHPEDRRFNQHNIQQLLLGKTESTTFENRYLRKDGGCVWVNLSLSLVRLSSGEPDYLIAVIEDITDRKQAEEALRQANSELETRVEERTLELKRAKEVAEAANRAKSTFLANMSHELRTPLNAILGFSELLVRDATMSADQLEQMEIINRCGEHLLNLINDILEMSKIEAGRVTLNPVTFNLYYLLDGLEDMLKFKAESKGLELVFDIAADLPEYIQADEVKLRQVLLNLLGNAVKFTAAGTVILRISIDDREPESNQLDRKARPFCTFLFEVQDTGPGIDAAELETIFEPFVQTKSGKVAQEGTGLGLPISQQFVRLMGGELKVTSTPGSGSTFTFHIPMEIVKPSIGLLAGAQQQLTIVPDQPLYRILIVEDNWANRKLLRRILEPFGFQLQEATNGKEAIECWQQWQPHLIWMDVRMPILDGYAATQHIRRLEQVTQLSASPPTKIIALTAGVFNEERAEILAAGCDDFVPKPLQEELILKKMAEHLSLRYGSRSLGSQSRLKPPLQPQNSQVSYPATAAACQVLPVSPLQVMSPEWIEQLYQQAIRLNAEEILELIDQLPPEQASLAQMLQNMVNNFAFDDIIELTKKQL